MTNVTVKEIEISENNVRWVELNGKDYGTKCEFTNEVYGVTDDDTIIDCDGIPLAEGDHNTIAVRNSLGL